MAHRQTFSVRVSSGIPESPPLVLPVPEGTRRPLWSVMMPVYNCSQYLPEALERVLRQDPGEERMQIEVVDDASTDADIGAMVCDIGRGRVSYFRQDENVGSVRNFNTCLDRSRGQLVHILHGDDRPIEGFYIEMEKLFAAYPSIGAAFCRYAYINEHGATLYHQDAEMACAGVPENWLVRLCERQRIQYVALAARRETYERLGGFYGVTYGEDWEMWVRMAAAYPMAYTPKVLAEYRRHNASVSGRCFATGENMTSLMWVMNQIQDYLPADRRRQVMDASRKFYAHYALRVANALWKQSGNARSATIQAMAAWKMSRDAGLLFKILKLYSRMALNL